MPLSVNCNKFKQYLLISRLFFLTMQEIKKKKVQVYLEKKFIHEINEIHQISKVFYILV